MLQFPACKANWRPSGWKVLSLHLAQNDSTAYIIMAFYLTSGKCWYVLCYHFHCDSLKAFSQLCTLFLKWKINPWISDDVPQLSPPSTSPQGYLYNLWCFRCFHFVIKCFGGVYPLSAAWAEKTFSLTKIYLTQNSEMSWNNPPLGPEVLFHWKVSLWSLTSKNMHKARLSGNKALVQCTWTSVRESHMWSLKASEFRFNNYQWKLF